MELRQAGREVVAQSNPTQDLAIGVSHGTDNAVTGMVRGAGNFAIGTANALTNPLGPAGAVAGVPNPFAIHPYTYDNEAQASYGSATGAGLNVGTIFAGGALGGSGSSLSVVPEEGPPLSRGAQLITEWLEGGATRVDSTSDLMLQSADGQRTIHFDLVNSHGLDPHVNVLIQRPRNLYPGDGRWIEIANEHIFPK